MFEIDKTSMFRSKYEALPVRLRRRIQEGIEILKETPTDYRGRIMYMAKRKDKSALYRFQLQGIQLFYLLHPDTPVVTMTNLSLNR